jgi:predicted permease
MILESLWTVTQNVLTLFLMIGVGVFLVKRGLLSGEGAAQLNTLLVNVVTPCVVVGAFQLDRSRVSLPVLGLTALLAVAVHLIGILVSLLFFRREPEDLRRVMRFAAIYSNCGFMGLPLVQALLGSEGTVYASVFLAVFNVVSWTHGYALMSGNGGQKFVRVLFNPGTVGVLVGLPLFLLGWRLPELVGKAVDGFAALNTPLAMLCIGVYISSVSLRETFLDLRLYRVCALRLLLIPALSLGLL